MSLAKNNDNENENKNVGDIVILLNERKTCDTWPIARVTKIFRSCDGVIRSVKVKLPIKVETKKKTTKQFAKINALLFDHRLLNVETSNRYTTSNKVPYLGLNPSRTQRVSDDPRDNNLLTITPFHLKMAKPVVVF